MGPNVLSICVDLVPGSLSPILVPRVPGGDVFGAFDVHAHGVTPPMEVADEVCGVDLGILDPCAFQAFFGFNESMWTNIIKVNLTFVFHVRSKSKGFPS